MQFFISKEPIDLDAIASKLTSFPMESEPIHFTPIQLGDISEIDTAPPPSAEIPKMTFNPQQFSAHVPINEENLKAIQDLWPSPSDFEVMIEPQPLPEPRRLPRKMKKAAKYEDRSVNHNKYLHRIGNPTKAWHRYANFIIRRIRYQQQRRALMQVESMEYESPDRVKVTLKKSINGKLMDD